MSDPSARAKQANILAVDDTPDSLHLLSAILREQGYRVRAVLDGPRALRAAKADPPDLVLLDVNMPEMNGFEVCAALKADEQLAEIPVIFISALTDTEDKVHAFEVGGVDYVTKPFQPEEVQVRVATRIELCRQRRQLKESYERLRELERLRDDLVHMIVHDMRTPLTGISGFLQLLQMQQLPVRAARHVSSALASTGSLIEMVSSLLDVSKMEAGQMVLRLAEHDLALLASEVVAKVDPLKGSRELAAPTPADPVTAVCDGDLIARVIQNLLGNALKFTPDGGSIRLHLACTEDVARVAVEDTGPGIPAEYQERIFEKFGQVVAREHKVKHSTGIGLTFCKLAVEAHGGRIGVNSAEGEGSTFWFEIPVRPPIRDVPTSASP